MPGSAGDSLRPGPENGGSRELTRQAAVWVASLVFALAFLVTTLAGGALGTAVVRGVAAASLSWVAARLLLRPLLSTVLDAMARDRSRTSEETAR